MTQLPKKTKHGKYAKRKWRIPDSERKKPFSEGQWIIEAECVNLKTGIIYKLIWGSLHPNLYDECKKMEDELRRKGTIITNILFTKL